ncbi:hypothetical protein [Sciscionella marina]|uniref:hypothetical protein n=1 Tax=Sciscionella marina TaxID=508770 RepID=UPI0012F64BF1|nr:hypothetical protein [Sciscionella marina]
MSSSDVSPRADSVSPWSFDASTDRGESYAALVKTLRQLQDVIACCEPSASRAHSAREHLAQAVASLQEFRTQPGTQQVRGDISGREDPLIVPVEITQRDQDSAEGNVQFSAFHHGGGGGVHGGSIAFVFDDLLGRLANVRKPTRTAYLHVNYRSVCPVQTNVVVRGQITSHERRKIFVSGTLVLGDTLIADCEGLWVVLPDTHDAKTRAPQLS